jgi:hypothetical protein
MTSWVDSIWRGKKECCKTPGQRLRSVNRRLQDNDTSYGRTPQTKSDVFEQELTYADMRIMRTCREKGRFGGVFHARMSA